MDVSRDRMENFGIDPDRSGFSRNSPFPSRGARSNLFANFSDYQGSDRHATIGAAPFTLLQWRFFVYELVIGRGGEITRIYRCCRTYHKVRFVTNAVSIPCCNLIHIPPF